MHKIANEGINDARYLTSKCPYYLTWLHMIQRCYAPPKKTQNPTYVDCTVTEEWKKFSVFKLWMETQDWKGKELDKDLIKPGNKIYGPASCCFIHSKLNRLLGATKRKGRYPQGVGFNKRNQRYIAQITIDSKNKYLGYYDTKEQAAVVYNRAKAAHVRVVAEDIQNLQIKEGLLKHAKLIEQGIFL